MVASVIILVFTALSEILNVILLTVMYGSDQANALAMSTNRMTQAIYTSPSTVFLAIFTVSGYFILKAIKKRNEKNGKASKGTGE